MKALLPTYCRPMGYLILLGSLFLPFIFLALGIITDHNLIFYKECIKLLMIAGALMILLALSKNETMATEQIRIKAIRQAVFLTCFFVFANMLYRVAKQEPNTVDSTSFLVFLIFNVLCLEYGMAKQRIDAMFKK